MPRKNLSIAEQAAQAADLGLHVVELKPMGKVPVHRGWQEHPLTTIEEVYGAFGQHPQANYGIATGHDGLFLVDVDGSKAIEWWKAQSFIPGAVVQTPNNGLHVYYHAYDVEVQTNSGKLFKVQVKAPVYGPREISPGKFELLEPAVYHQVDVRGVGGQGVGPGSMLPTGTYKGDIEAIANAPEAPAELMAIIPEKQAYTQVEWTGEAVTEATEKERQSVAWIIQRLQSLPEVWAPGAGWHTAVFESCAWLCRMVNSGAYAMTDDGAITILLSYTPTYGSEWGDDKILEQWQSAKLLTQGQFAEPPSSDEDIPRLLPLLKAQEGVPEYDSRGRQFMYLVWTDASSDTEGARWDRRRQIFLESFRAGLDMQRAFSLAAGCVAAEILMREYDGRLLLFKEAKKAYREYQSELASGLAVQENDTLEVALELDRVEKVELLSAEERALLSTEGGRWFGTRYLEWISESLKLANMPYHRLHIWMMLSVVFGMVGYVPREGKRLGSNLWGIIIGESSTGKTESLEKSESVMDAFFKDDSPDLGADATTEALHDALIGRDGKPSYQIIDEAHGLLGELAGSKGFRGDLITRWTEFYEGKVRASLRSTKKEISGRSATTSFSLLLQGTTAKMSKAMNTALWESGFLVRSIFTIGENITPSEEDLDVRLIEGDADQSYNGMPRQWAAEWANIQNRLRRHGDFPLKVEFSPEALERFNRGMRRMRKELKERPNQVALKPYAARYPNTGLKMAMLVALSEARIRVEVRDVIIALAASEEFLAAAVTMAKLTTDTDFAQQVDEVEAFIAERGGKVTIDKLYRHFAQRPKQEIDRLMEQLVAERRSIKRQETTGDFTVTLIREKERTSIAA